MTPRPRTGVDRSGFRIILLDLEESLRRVFSYRWGKSLYSITEDTDWKPYSRSASLIGRPTPLPKYLDKLSDSGIGLTHRTRGPIPLDSVFVYPDVHVSALSESDTQRDVKGENLLKYLSEADKVIISGSAYRGKTSLAKTVVKEFLRNRSFHPLLISGGHVKEANQSFVERFIKTSVTDSYGSENSERYHQLPTPMKALVIDDWDESPLSHDDRDKFLHTALTQFGKVLLFVRGMSYIQYVLTKLKGTEAILKFELVSIKEFSHVARGDLIEKWLGLECEAEGPDFARKVEQTERLVETVIGKNTLPSLPLIVLAILEASQRDSDSLPENGSFGYLYEVLITAALSTTQGDKPQLDKKYTFLALLSFQLFHKGVELLPEHEVHDLLDEYSKNFRVKVDKETLLKDLETARVLVKADGNYSFGYSHYFYYFLARHFKNNIHGEDGDKLRKQLNSIAAGLNIGNNSIFLMFFIYLSHDDKLIDHCVALGDRILSEVAPSDLTDEVEFYNSKDSAGVIRKIPESVDLKESRRRRREGADEAQPRVRGETIALDTENAGYSDELPLGTKLDYAFSCVDVLGQILRNFTGSLPGERKMAILKTTYLLGLRTLRAMLVVLSDATVSAREELAKRDAAKREEREFIRRIEKLLTIVGQIVGVNTIQTVSLSIGSPDIDEAAYAETLDAVGHSNASELVDLSIRLDHSSEYPFNQIKSLYKQFSTNRFAQRVLRDLVIGNMHVFEIGHEMRQRVLATLEAGRPDDSLLSRAGKRLRP